MNQDRLGTALMLAAAVWMAMIAFTEPGNSAALQARSTMVAAAIGLVVLAFFPSYLFLTGTVFAFSVLGVCLYLAVFGVFGIGVTGFASPILLVIAMWLRRDRLDGDTIVVITAVVACSLAIIQPQVVIFAWSVIGIVNLAIWLLNASGATRKNPQSRQSAHP